jgi:hypothetical protein
MIEAGRNRSRLVALLAPTGECDQPLPAAGRARPPSTIRSAFPRDQFAVMVAPVALGKGLPLFSELAAPTPLELMSSKAFPGGAVAQIYRPA